jgi:hypothetical protein
LEKRIIGRVGFRFSKLGLVSKVNYSSDGEAEICAKKPIFDEFKQKQQLMEIIETEKTYITNLKYLMEFFFEPLLNNYAEAGFSSKNILKQVIPTSLWPLIEAHEHFSQALCAKSPSVLHVCQVFLAHIKLLQQPHEVYSEELASGLDNFKTLKKTFTAFIDVS